VKTTYSANEVAQVFIREIVRLHDALNKIVSDKNSKFILRFWKELFVGLETELAFNTIIIHKHMDQIERVNMILEEMLRL